MILLSTIIPAHAVDMSVGQLTIYSCSGTHAFISFKNTSSDPYDLGSLRLGRGAEVTIGTWGNKPSHVGIWYNLESYLHHEVDSSVFSGRVSLTMSVDRDDVNIIDNLILANDTWSQNNNCSSFAVKIWNAVSPTKLSAGSPNSPSALAQSIRSKPGYQTNRSIPNASPVGYAENRFWYSATYSWSPELAVTAYPAIPIYDVIQISISDEISTM